MWSIFPLLWCQRNLILLFLWYKILCKTHKKHTWIPFILLGQVFKLNEWCLVDCFDHKLRVSTQIMVNYCNAKCKKLPGLLMASFFCNSKYLH